MGPFEKRQILRLFSKEMKQLIVIEVYQHLGRYVSPSAQLIFNPCEVATHEKAFLPFCLEEESVPAQCH